VPSEACPYKGLFVGTAGIKKPLDVREWPFHDNWKRYAETAGRCAILGRDLLVAYFLHAEGKLDVDGFWRALYDTDGIFDLGPFMPQVDDNSADLPEVG
jgi:hypothetical protein